MSRDGEPGTTRLSGYNAPALQIRNTELTFDIHPGVTTVHSVLRVERVIEGGEGGEGEEAELVLDGQELELVSIAVDGHTLSANEYQLDEDSLTLFDLPDQCELSIVNTIHPEENTALEGLYKSRSMFCTQCEAEGFRKITYYQDRPDVLSVFTTTIIAEPDYPVLLSNGNPAASEVLPDGRRKVTWHDPFPKPSYLFALVAGDLALVTDSFLTRSGRNVELRIYSEPHNIGQCSYAMDVLKRAMRWDEEVFGREYDLDIFMIVAVEDFNMGAMENKGLNIFNTSCVLATPDTATDLAYQRVEGVVAHEYFHNWSGNRVTCRDWFQLSLKEGFTVFRDAEFSSDMNSRTVKRIEDVNFLRSVQFAEDAGPLAHPIRPDSYIEISNFYTPTVYEKGAEVIRMLHTIAGPESFRRGCDLYFERHDGQAATTEDFLAAMAEASGEDLSIFERWYHQAGTPVLDVSASWVDGEFRLTMQQTCPATPGQAAKKPFHIPVEIGLIDPESGPLVGEDLQFETESQILRRDDTLVVHLQTEHTTLLVRHLEREPQVSFLRGFSAPVRVNFDRGPESLTFLATHDTDGFAAWDAMQTLLVAEITRMMTTEEVSDHVVSLYAALLSKAIDDVAGGNPEACFLVAAKLTIPTEAYLVEQFLLADVAGICDARDRLATTLGRELSAGWEALYAATQATGHYVPDAPGMSRRALNNLSLAALSEAIEPDKLSALLKSHYDSADNLTDRRAALSVAVNVSALNAESVTTLLEDFYARWRAEALVVNQWFAVQAASRLIDADGVKLLAAHPAFDMGNPNKIRSVYSAFVHTNLRNFHARDGSGYDLIGDVVIELNGRNPQMAAALAKPLTRWRRFAGEQPRMMTATLERIAACEGLSSDVFEVVEKGLSGITNRG